MDLVLAGGVAVAERVIYSVHVRIKYHRLIRVAFHHIPITSSRSVPLPLSGPKRIGAAKSAKRVRQESSLEIVESTDLIPFLLAEQIRLFHLPTGISGHHVSHLAIGIVPYPCHGRTG